MDRRKFLKIAGVSGGLMSISPLLAGPYNNAISEAVTLTILHTNDVHSRIDPFPADAGRNAGLAGAKRRLALIEKVRSEEKNVLLLDSGDWWQGTPYFNMYGGELEFKVMSAMKYDATTIGNHDFDAGIGGLVKQLPHADFDILSCNYSFEDKTLKQRVKPFKAYEKGGVKVGVFGLGIDPGGLVPEDLYVGTQYQDPISRANEIAAHLKGEESCDLCICLSHLGHKYDSDKVSDVVLAGETRNIDIILGGHTHTFMRQPDKQFNKDGKQVCIHQVGFAGIYLGRIDVHFELSKKSHCVSCENIWVKS